MKTIHIKDFSKTKPGSIYAENIPELKSLIRALYRYALKEDPLFHFFCEPDLILRISSKKILGKVKTYLEKRKLKYEEYDYPFPKILGQFGEDPKGVVAKNLDLFLPLLHAHAVAAITMGTKDHSSYLERVIHTAFNPRSYAWKQEGELLMRIGESRLKAGKAGPKG